LFAEEVLSNRKEAVQQEKMIENVKKSNQRNLSKRIDVDKHIFDNNDPPVAKKPRKTNSDKKNSNEAEVPCTKVVKIKKSHSVSMASEKDKSTFVSNSFQERENLRKQSQLQSPALKERFMQQSESTMEITERSSSFSQQQTRPVSYNLPPYSQKLPSQFGSHSTMTPITLDQEQYQHDKITGPSVTPICQYSSQESMYQGTSNPRSNDSSWCHRQNDDFLGDPYIPRDFQFRRYSTPASQHHSSSLESHINYDSSISSNNYNSQHFSTNPSLHHTELNAYHRGRRDTQQFDVSDSNNYNSQHLSGNFLYTHRQVEGSSNLTLQKNNDGYENTVPIPQFLKTTEPCLPPVNAAENDSNHSDKSRTFIEIGTATRHENTCNNVNRRGSLADSLTQNISTVQSKDHQQKRMINRSTEIRSRQSETDNADKNESVGFENGKAPADKLQNAFAFINTEIHSSNIICDDPANINDEAHSDKSVTSKSSTE